MSIVHASCRHAKNAAYILTGKVIVGGGRGRQQTRAPHVLLDGDTATCRCPRRRPRRITTWLLRQQL